MTKPSPMMVYAEIPLENLPPQELAVIRRFLFQHIRGADEKSDKRWRRLWGRIVAAEPGEGIQLESLEERCGPFHMRHRKILDRLFNSQETYYSIDALHDWMKLGAYWVTWENGRIAPRTTDFPNTSEDEMREAHGRMVDYLHTEPALQALWPHLTHSRRLDALEAVLADPKSDAAR